MDLHEFRFLLLLSLLPFVISSSKQVSIRDKSIGQLVTSSLLTWESFNAKSDPEQQFKFAIIGGQFTDVSMI